MRGKKMAFISLKPGAMLAPVPAALITCGAEERGTLRQNVMTAAWVGTVCTKPPMVSVSIRPSRYSLELIDRSGEFAVNLTDRALLRAADYCGVRSGREEDKFAACGLTRAELPPLKYAPGIAESPVCLGCRVRGRQELGSHILFLGEIVYLGIRPDLMDEQGKVNLQKADLIAYSHGLYQSLSEPLGFFGFSVAAPEVLERRMAEIRDQARE